MKVLVNAISAKKGGIITYTVNLMRSFKARGVDATFAVSPEFPETGLLPTLACSSSHYPPLRRVLWEQLVWPRIVRRQRPDVLFSSANFGLLRSPVPQVLLLREGGLFDSFYLANVAPAQSLRAAATRVVRRKLIMASAKAADWTLTPTQAMRDTMLDWMPFIADHCSVNSYGTLDGIFVPPAKPRAWAEDGVLRLLYVSVYYPHKNPGVLAEAVRLLNRNGIKAHATITMDPGEFTLFRGSALDRSTVMRAVADGLVTLGRWPYEQLPDLYHAHDAFVFPSVSETFGHPMAEAMGCCLPVVAADTAVNRDVCGDAAEYVPPFSVEGLAETLVALGRNPERRHAMIEQGHARILVRFRWEDHVDRLLAVLERTARGPRRSPG
jgi:glycosyltransferase involved in cell wall biosynthesis